MKRSDFGDDFTWGVASAAFQIEGAWDVDGKAPSVWDMLGHSGRILGGAVGDDAIDFYNRYESDIALIRDLGFNANRFSISWPRILGDGTPGSPVNNAGIDFYNRVIDATLDAGLEPWVTVHHWDMPEAILRQGGWANRDAVLEPFVRLAEVCAESFGDRVTNWMVFNEPASVASHLVAGMYGRRGFYPVRTLRCVHHMNLAIAAGARRMRELLPADAQIGTTNIIAPARPYAPADRATQKRKSAIEALTSDMFIDPAGGLGYPFERNRVLNLMKPAIADGDVEACAFHFDFLGIQYYGPVPLSDKPLPLVGSLPTTKIPGAEVNLRSDIGIPTDPEGLGYVLRRYAHHPIADRLVVTESGLGAQDRLDGDRVHDDVRIWHTRRHLEAVLDARRDGVPVDGFFQWSYADNIEWFFGRRPRFGIVYVDYDDDYRRVPKDSAKWFKAFLAGEEG